jgi:hypothetical protein
MDPGACGPHCRQLCGGVDPKTMEVTDILKWAAGRMVWPGLSGLENKELVLGIIIYRNIALYKLWD